MIRLPKSITFSLFALTSLSRFASAEVDLEQLPGDTNWLVHLDVTSLQGTQLWTQMGKDHFDRAIEENGIPLDPDKVIDVVHTITLHGSTVEMDEAFDGVVIVQGTEELTSIVEALVLSFVGPEEEEQGADASEPAEPTAEDPYTIYRIGPDVTIALLSDSRVAISKSATRIAHCVDVMAGDEPNLATSRNLEGFSSSTNPFFQLGARTDLVNRPVPPELEKVLRLIDGLQLEVGERDQNVALAIAAHSPTAEVALELSKVVDGASTLAGIIDPENEWLVTLTESIRVAASGRMVRLSASYPVETLMEMIQAMQPPPFAQLIGDDDRTSITHFELYGTPVD